MKKIFTIAALLLVAITAGAQVDSTFYADQEYTQPNVNPTKLFGNNFCSHFAEVLLLGSTQGFGAGVDYAYNDEVWGVHASVLGHPLGAMAMVGPDFRFSKPWGKTDWHVSGSAGAMRYTDGKYAPLLGAGLRWAPSRERGKFCFTSTSVNVFTDFQHIYATVGFGVTIGIFASSLLLLGLGNNN